LLKQPDKHKWSSLNFIEIDMQISTTNPRQFTSMTTCPALECGLLVDMVTRNPAKTLRWQDEVGSIEAGKVADIFVITNPVTCGGRTVARQGSRDQKVRSYGGTSEVKAEKAPRARARIKPAQRGLFNPR
jgi:cytosine/adenosine deaminase-related metal-dependent hydrolase